MEAILKHGELALVEEYWKMLSSLSRTVKLGLASKLTHAVLEEEMADEEREHHRRAKVVKRVQVSPSDAELETRFAHLEMPKEPEEDPSWSDIVKANSGKTIKPIEKWL